MYSEGVARGPISLTLVHSYLFLVSFFNGGKYKDDKRHGKGKCTYVNGDEYEREC